jgi:hypothetical protein
MALHEPYYANYVQDDLITAIARKGFTHQVTDFAYFSKVMSFRAR